MESRQQVMESEVLGLHTAWPQFVCYPWVLVSLIQNIQWVIKTLEFTVQINALTYNSALYTEMFLNIMDATTDFLLSHLEINIFLAEVLISVFNYSLF